jgi:hypothetical protein
VSQRLLEQLRILRQTDALALHQLCLEPQTQRLLRRYGISDGTDVNLTSSTNLTKLSDGIDASVGSGGTGASRGGGADLREATRASNGVVLGEAHGVVLGEAARAAVGMLDEDNGVVLGEADGVVLGETVCAAVGTLDEDHDGVEAPPTSRATKRIHRLHDELDELDEAYP